MNWISVEERLPLLGDPVKWHIEFDIAEVHPTHWMPLPEPPKQTKQ